MRLVIWAAVIAWAACEAAGPADYSPTAVLEGRALHGQGHPVPGLTIEVWLLKDSCAAAPVPTVSEPDQVRTDLEGRFSGSFETLGAGPISVACILVRALDEEGAMVTELLVEESTEWTSPPRDTVVVQLTTETG